MQGELFNDKLVERGVKTDSPYVDSGAIMSTCQTYRYILWREWRGYGKHENWLWYDVDIGVPKACVFIMLNPSTADANKDDPTIRKCVKFAQSWGFDRLEVVNLFAYRATDPKQLMKLSSDQDPVGEDNHRCIEETTSVAGKIICAWGNHGTHMDQYKKVLNWIPFNPDLEALMINTKTGQPRHPLYVPDNTVPISYN